MATTASDRAYVWVWLPGAAEPVPAGVLEHRGGEPDLSFRYGDRYVERSDAISLYAPQLPLQADAWFDATANLGLPGCLRDAAPDSWGRRAIASRWQSTRRSAAGGHSLSEVDILLESSSDRFGAVDFQRSPTEYQAREGTAALDDLERAAQLIQNGEDLRPGLETAALGATALGGARPKALLSDGDRQLIAKFADASDVLDMVGTEAASIHLARAVGIEVPEAEVVTSLGLKVLLVERFDRLPGGRRRMVVSGLTMLDLPDTSLPLGSYPGLLDVLRKVGRPGSGAALELFLRIAFNIAISNTDDHLRNHAAFWDGEHLELTPAYDLSPSPRSGETAEQALPYDRAGQRDSNLASLIKVCHLYDLSTREATALIEKMIDTITRTWEEAADAGQLTRVDRRALWGKQFRNPGSLRGLGSRN